VTLCTYPEVGAVEALVTETAEEELLPRFTRSVSREKADGSLVTEADLAVQHRLSAALAERWPGIGFLGEEMAPREQARVLGDGRPFWCLDPLDGTRNFAAGLPFFAVSLALVADGEVVLGIVYDPVRRECFSAGRGNGSRLNGVPLAAPSPPSLAGSIGLIDLKRLPQALAGRLAAEMPFASQRSFGAVALDWCWLAAGRCHVYLHGRQHLWDYAAGRLVFAGVGGYATTLEGGAEPALSLTPRSAVAAANLDLYEEWTAWLEIDSSPRGAGGP